MKAAAAKGADCGSPRTPFGSRRGWWRLGALLGVHLLVLAHVLHWKAAGTTLAPLEPSEAGETLTSGVINAGFVLFALLLVSTLVLGRFFCGWACHMVALQDACAWLLTRLKLKPKPIRSRLLVFVPLFAAFEMFMLPSLLLWFDGHGFPELSWHLTTDDLWARFPGPGIALLTFGVDGFLLVWLLGAKGFCTYGCPYGALFAVAERAAPARIRVSPSCDGCAHCTAVCTSNVEVHREVALYGQVVDSGCMKCLDCVSSCPKGALSFGFGESRSAALARGTLAQPKRVRSFDFHWGEELALALCFLLALYAFRDLYGAVPFLLALGLALLSAVALVWCWRSLRQAEFRWQRSTLSRKRPAGIAAAASACLWLGFSAHSGLVQWHTHEGERTFAAAGTLSRVQGAQRAEHYDQAQRSLARALELGLFERADLHAKRGLALRELGRQAEAEEELLQAVELDSKLHSARIALADLLLLRGEGAAAQAQVEKVLELDPHNAGARARLEALTR